MLKVVNIRYARRQNSIIGDIQNNSFVIYMIIKKVDVSILQKNIVYVVKKLHNKRIFWNAKKCLLNVLLKVSFFLKKILL